MAYTYSGASAITASSILPFGYWNAFISNNASAFNEGITAVSAALTGLSGLFTAHSATVSGMHGMRANAGPVGSLSGSGFVVQSATAMLLQDDTGTFVWPQPFVALPVLAAAGLYIGAADVNARPQIIFSANYMGSAVGMNRGASGIIYVLAFGRI